MVQYNVMCVMVVRACAWVPVLEKAHTLMKRIHIMCNGKVYRKLLGRDGDVAERARWLTLTRIPGSVWPIVSLL